MTIQELIESLQAMIENGEADAETEVRIAHQPSYPFELSIQGVEAADLSEDPDNRNVIVYIAEGSQLGYLPGVVSNYLGWR